jgi:hypothetical protein
MILCQHFQINQELIKLHEFTKNIPTFVGN